MSTTRVTIKDVAARAGVSKGAVSLAFNQKPGLADATRERIFEAARELGWAPHPTARSLAGARVDVVGLAVCRPARLLGLEPFYMEFMSGVESVLIEHSCALLLRLVRSAEEEVGLQESWWRTRQVGGAILVDFRADDPRVAVVRRLGLPVVAVGHPSLTGGLTSVWTDDAGAVTEVVRYLAGLGHRRIARVGGAAALTALRTAAFGAAARALGPAGARQLATDSSGEAGARATRSLLTGAVADRPTAIVYDNDIMAVAGLAVAAELGLAVPADVSVLAWDDSELCRITHPTLSAMSHDVHGFGADAARTLFGVITGEGSGSHPVPAPVLTPRGSTAPPGA
ncbi:LacI family transcriptional regulator [Streptomyces sp. NBC_01622]|uniref:LacI family DNA-binding transcriptional regulator n=1 Tax=Streptomyces sp. NBC_01622 TaxID=2975903 RepID=UPI00386957F5|nr:LacI family transcriptional regulator [Streptomyces sp. NBC_01622]